MTNKRKNIDKKIDFFIAVVNGDSFWKAGGPHGIHPHHAYQVYNFIIRLSECKLKNRTERYEVPGMKEIRENKSYWLERAEKVREHLIVTSFTGQARDTAMKTATKKYQTLARREYAVNAVFAQH